MLPFFRSTRADFVVPSVRVALIVSIEPVDLVEPHTDRGWAPWELRASRHRPRLSHLPNIPNNQKPKYTFEKSNTRYSIRKLDYLNVCYLIQNRILKYLHTPTIQFWNQKCLLLWVSHDASTRISYVKLSTNRLFKWPNISLHLLEC